MSVVVQLLEGLSALLFTAFVAGTVVKNASAYRLIRAKTGIIVFDRGLRLS